MIDINLQVMHKKFGLGTVTTIQGKYITVKFNDCEKNFVYPDSFEKYLTLADGTVSDDILSDLAVSNAEKQFIIDMKNQENLHAMKHGIVIPGKEIVIDGSDDEDGHDKSSETDDV